MQLIKGSSAIVETVRFRGKWFSLEGELIYPEQDQAKIGVVIAGPHPFLGGNMNNNVVRSLGDELAEKGYLAMRFNYRGVGNSEGPPIDVPSQVAEFWRTSHVADEMTLAEDVQAAVDFVEKDVAQKLPLILIGYSFGCSLLPQIATEMPRPGQILIAPTLGKHSYESYASSPVLTHLIASEDDFVNDAAQLEQFQKILPRPGKLIHKRCDNHFFRGHESWLADTICSLIESGSNAT